MICPTEGGPNSLVNKFAQFAIQLRLQDHLDPPADGSSPAAPTQLWTTPIHQQTAVYHWTTPIHIDPQQPQVAAHQQLQTTTGQQQDYPHIPADGRSPTNYPHPLADYSPP